MIRVASALALRSLALSALLLLAACADEGSLRPPPLEPMGGGSFGLSRGSLIADYTWWGLGNAEQAVASFRGTLLLTPLVCNPGGNCSVYGQAKRLSVYGEDEVDIADVPGGNGRYSGAAFVWEDAGIPAPDFETQNRWFRAWLVQSEAGSCIVGSFRKDGRLDYEAAKRIVRDDGVLLVYDGAGVLLEDRKEIRGEFVYQDVAPTACS